MRTRRSLLLVALAALALPAAAQAYGVQTVRARLAQASGRAGAYSGAYAVDLTTGRSLFSSRADRPRVPASVNKLWTISTALLRLGPSAMFATRVLGRGQLGADGTYRGNLWLRGGGDPTLTSARLAALARALRDAGVRRVDGRVLGDESLFDHLRGSAETGGRPDGYIEGLLSALSLDRGLSGGGLEPDLFAARRLTARLRGLRIAVTRGSGIGITPADARPLASVSSPTLSALAAQTLVPSDNFYAETLIKDLGARLAGAGTTAAGARVVRAEWASHSAFPRIVDGSGLSRSDRTSPRQLVRMLGYMSASAVARPFRRALPVAGVSGTLAGRMRGTAAAGRCSAKTGTITGVSALAGYCPSRDGHTIAFAFLMNAVSISGARVLQDRMTATLAGATLG